MKKLITILLVLLLVVGGAAWYFVTYHMDSMIESQIESAGSTSLGTRVSVGNITTSIREGSLAISEITIANPPGFNNKNAFILSGIEAAVDYESLEIKRLIINDPEIVIEEKGGETNFSRMQAELEKMSSDPAPAAEGKKEPVIVIRHFRMNESRAAFESESMNRYSDLKIGAVELNNIKGTPSEVANVIATEIVGKISQAAAVELLKAKASEKIGNIFGKD